MIVHVLLMLKGCAKRQEKNYMLYIESVTMTLSQRRIIMKAFIVSQFGYCPLVWIFHGNSAKQRKIFKKNSKGIKIKTQVFYVLNNLFLESIII